MLRIPVAATIREAYAFAGSHLGSVIGLIWVPMVVLTITGFFTFQRYYNDLIDAMASGNPAGMGPSVLMLLGYLVAAVVLFAVIYVAVIQLALGTRSPGAVMHFAFGAPEWRMFRAFFAFVGLVVVLGVAAILVGSAFLTALSGHPSQTASGVTLLLLFYGLILLVTPRFLLLLPAIAVGESAPVLRRAWALSAGNFWRLLAVLLAVFAPVLLVLIGAELVLAGRGPVLAGTSDQVQLIAAIVRGRQLLPILSGLQFLFSPVLIALFAGASVASWRALKDGTVAVPA